MAIQCSHQRFYNPSSSRRKNAACELQNSIATVAFLAGSLLAQNAQQPGYLNTALPAQQRAEDLVRHMTVEEKVTQLVNQSRAIPRLNVPAYDWWSEALHGVA